MQIGLLPLAGVVKKRGTPQGRKDRIRLKRCERPPLDAMNYDQWHECVLSNAKKRRLTDAEKEALYNQYLVKFD